MLKSPSMWSVPALLFGLGICSPGSAHQAAPQVRTEGSCSPVIHQSQVTGHVTIQCDAGRADLARMEERINRLIEESGMTRSQVGEFAALLNAFAEARASRSRLSGVMTTWLATALGAQTANENVNVYMAAIDNADPSFGMNGEFGLYRFFAGPRLYAPNQATCSIQDGVVLTGTRSIATRNDRGVVRELNSPLPSDDPILQRICRGMSASLTTIMTDGQRRTNRLSIHDYLAQGKPIVALVLFPRNLGSVPLDDFRTFWTSAFVARQFGSTPTVNLAPEAFADAVGNADPNDGDESAETSVSFDLSVTSALFQSVTLDQPYPPTVREEFGRDLAEMDAKWQQRIADATINLRGDSFRLFEQGRPRQLLRAFRMRELDSSEFWRSIGDGWELYRQRTCLAARFAVDEGYSTPGDLPGYERCGISLYGR